MSRRPIEDIGELDQRVELMHKVYASDGAGGQAITLGDPYATVWAHVRPLSGRERLNAERTEASGEYLFVIRNRADVLEGDVARWNGREYNVRFQKSRGRRARYLELVGETGVGL